MAGSVSWWLFTYLLSGVMLPLTFSLTAALDDIAFSQWAVPALKILMPHIPAYLLDLGFCLVLGMKSRVTILRVACFTVAANGVCLYYHVMQLTGSIAHGKDASGREWIILGMISPLIISPLFAVMGSLAGRSIRKRNGLKWL